VSTTSGGGGAGQGGGGTTTSTSAGGGGTTSTTTTSAGGGGGGTTTTSSGAGGGAAGAADPNADGPYAIAELDDKITVAATGDGVAVHVAYPTVGPKGGPYPLVLVGHGFQLPITQYAGYAKRLATFGYVAATVDFPNAPDGGGFLPNHVRSAQDFVGVIDGIGQIAALAGKVDTSTVGATGHSLGGKLAFLGATMEPRVKAAITLDPVDSATFCSADKCPDVSGMMGTLKIPTGVLGESTDAKGGLGGQACAPAADNFSTFYANAPTPALSVEVLGANHMSFLDDVASCVTCGFCNKATLDNGVVNDLAKAYVTAFYERWLRGDAAYDTYLTGAEAEARYVAKNLVTIQSK
jgi:predicted dienelactone hydrolase